MGMDVCLAVRLARQPSVALIAVPRPICIIKSGPDTYPRRSAPVTVWLFGSFGSKSMDHKSCVGDSAFQVYAGRFPQIVVDAKTPISWCLRLFVSIDLHIATIHIDF